MCADHYVEKSAQPDSSATPLPLRESIMDGDRQQALAILRSRSGAAPQSPTESASTQSVDPASCPQSPLYERLMTMAARNIYDPGKLGDLPTLMNKFNCQINSPADAMSKANKALKITGDEHNSVMTPAEVKADNDETAGVVSGIGVRLHSIERKSEHRTRIDEVPDNTPAKKADLREGDYIIRVNGKGTSKMSAEQVAALTGDEAGTNVALRILRDGRQIDRTLTREITNLPSVRKPADMGHGITYIQIHQFGFDTAEGVRKAIESTPKSRGYIIDLRNNGGGLMIEGIATAELLVKNGVIFKMRERLDSDPDKPEYRTTTHAVDAQRRTITLKDGETAAPTKEDSERYEEYLLNGRPVVILMNGGTASSSELLVGAAHDSGKATTLGTKSLGKGIGQMPVGDRESGALVVVTNLRFFTPSGHWLGDAQGKRYPLHPDKTVENPKNIFLRSKDDAQLQAGIRHLRTQFGN